MEQSIRYLTKLINLELDDVVFAKIGEKLQGLDGNDFILFVEDNLDNVGLDYKNGLQKFLKLVKMYKDKISEKRVESAENEAYFLAKKFTIVNSMLTDERSRGKFPRLEFLKVRGQDYFSSFEIKQLNAIGDIDYLLKLSTDGNLEQAIKKQFMKLIHNQTNKLLGNSQRLKLEVKRF